MLTPGLVSITFRSLSAEDIVEHVSRNGLNAIEWGGDVHVPHGETEVAQRVSRLTADAGLAVAAYGSYYKFQQLFDEEGPEWEAVLDTAEALGAPTLRVWAGLHGSAETDPSVRGAIVERSRVLAEQAEARGIELAFEYHRNTLTDTNESAKRLLDEIGHPNARTLWQPPNGASLEYCTSGLRAISDKLSNIHCFHWGPAGSSDKRPLAEGAERWREYLRIAAEVTPKETTRYVLLEFVAGGTIDMFVQDAAVLRGWLEQVNKSLPE